jgi:predicted MFS family arabinose efflux permease
LFLSEFRSAFALSTQAAGLVSGAGFASLLLGLLVAQHMTARRGPRLPVVVGLSLAALGMAIVAAAPGVVVLTLGVCLAMSSTGFAWTPFNEAVQRRLPDGARPAALSAVSTGTALGIAAAGAAALLASLYGVSWRLCWAVFAAAGALAALANLRALREAAGPRPSPRAWRWRAFAAPAARPLFAVALSFGVTSAIYISFAADRIARAGGLEGLPPGAAPGAVYGLFGLFGLLGVFTGRARTAAGLARLLHLLLFASALSLALVAVAPVSWTGVVLSAGLQGVNVMMTSAVLAFWSERLFPGQPARGFTAALLAYALGSVAGPILAGAAAQRLGEVPMFLGAAAVSLGTAAALRPAWIRERAAERAAAAAAAG